jgi:hypothetical protein
VSAFSSPLNHRLCQAPARAYHKKIAGKTNCPRESLRPRVRTSPRRRQGGSRWRGRAVEAEVLVLQAVLHQQSVNATPFGPSAPPPCQAGGGRVRERGYSYLASKRKCDSFASNRKIGRVNKTARGQPVSRTRAEIREMMG